jgi:IclR family pca regulon transcriptional regulator
LGRILLADLSKSEADAVLAASDLKARTPNTVTNRSDLHRELSKARDQGWYVLDEELELGLRSAAAPVIGTSGRVIAAINVSTASARTSVARIESEFVPHLVQAASQISAAVGSH